MLANTFAMRQLINIKDSSMRDDSGDSIGTISCPLLDKLNVYSIFKNRHQYALVTLSAPKGL